MGAFLSMQILYEKLLLLPIYILMDVPYLLKYRVVYLSAPVLLKREPIHPLTFFLKERKERKRKN
jgi:hypothetical protein